MKGDLIKFYTVGDLRKSLEGYPDDMPVSLCFDDGKITEQDKSKPEFRPIIAGSLAEDD